MRTAKALARLRGCADSPGPSLVAYVISIIIFCAGSFTVMRLNNKARDPYARMRMHFRIRKISKYKDK